jgi:hypothetical protein
MLSAACSENMGKTYQRNLCSALNDYRIRILKAQTCRIGNQCDLYAITTQSSQPSYTHSIKHINGMMMIRMLHVHPVLGNRLVNKFPRREILRTQSVARSRNNRMNVYSSLLGNNQRANELARVIT